MSTGSSADIPELELRRKALAQQAKTVMLGALREERQPTEAEAARIAELRDEVARIERQLQDAFDGHRGAG
jgi:hypothetical protein